jgi:HlyD family secretion protein
VRIGNAQRPVVPRTAVLTDTNGSYVYIVGADNKATRRAVSVAETSEQGVVIEAGLTGKEQVVTTAAGFLRPGEQVKVAVQPAS